MSEKRQKRYSRGFFQKWGRVGGLSADPAKAKRDREYFQLVGACNRHRRTFRAHVDPEGKPCECSACLSYRAARAGLVEWSARRAAKKAVTVAKELQQKAKAG